MPIKNNINAAEASTEDAQSAVSVRGLDAPDRPASVDAVTMERGRKQAIHNLCTANSLDRSYADMWIGQGANLLQVSEDILRLLEERGKTNPQPASKLGMTPKEVRQFSLVRAIRAVADKDWKGADFELDTCRALANKLGRSLEPTKLIIPFDVLQRDMYGADRAQIVGRLHRDLTAGTAGAGGYLVGTDNMGFIELLRNRMVAFRMGARRLSGLQGNVTIPRQSASATGYWLATEGTAITESQQTFVQLAMTPKTVSGYTEMSRLLLMQSSPGAEGIVTDDLAQVVAVAADLGVLEGSGAAGQPTGIANTAGIGSVTGTTLDYAGILGFQTDVAGSNVVPVNGGYVTTAAVAALLAARARFSNTDTPLWDGNIWDATMAGFPAMSSEQLTAASMIFGDWQEIVIGEWGVLEVEVNPYANFAAGVIGVRCMYSLDSGVRRPFAFSRATAIT